MARGPSYRQRACICSMVSTCAGVSSNGLSRLPDRWLATATCICASARCSPDRCSNLRMSHRVCSTFGGRRRSPSRWPARSVSRSGGDRRCPARRTLSARVGRRPLWASNVTLCCEAMWAPISTRLARARRRLFGPRSTAWQMVRRSCAARRTSPCGRWRAFASSAYPLASRPWSPTSPPAARRCQQASRCGSLMCRPKSNPTVRSRLARASRLKS